MFYAYIQNFNVKKPSLTVNPQLTDNYSRERWISDAFEKNGSESAKLARISIVSRLDHYCLKVHKMKTEDVFEWMKKEAKTPEILTQYAIDFLSQYVKFCQKDQKTRHQKKTCVLIYFAR